MAARLLLHVGYHKTGTTWAQRSLFTPDNGFRQIATHQQVHDHIVAPHGLRYSQAAMRDVIAAGLERLDDGEVPVISSEILCGHPFYGGHESDVYAARLKALAPDARILITIRAQPRIIASVYMQYVLRGGTMPFEQFFAGTTEPGYFGFSPEHFEYDALAALYQELFGAENVYVLTQERLLSDIDGAARDVAEFAGVQGFGGLSAADKAKTGVSYPEYAAPLLRRINHFQSSTLNPRPILSLGRTPHGLFKVGGHLAKSTVARRLFSNRTPVTDYAAKTFSEQFAESNARLESICHNPLDLSGYP